jgi:DhnA family fructose-bisphosphate aldolase class Ia
MHKNAKPMTDAEVKAISHLVERANKYVMPQVAEWHAQGRHDQADKLFNETFAELKEAAATLAQFRARSSA